MTMFPSSDYGTLDICDLYLPHAKAALSYKQFSPLDGVSWALLAGGVSRYFYKRRSYNLASTLAHQALELHEAVHRKEHPDTLTPMDQLALALRGQGRQRSMHRSSYKFW